MDDVDGPPRMTRLTFHGPLSEDRTARMIRRLTSHTDVTTVLDIGCGWGEFMLRLLEATPGAMGIGIDLNDEDLARGRANAEARNLSDRLPGARDDHPPRRSSVDERGSSRSASHQSCRAHITGSR
jgi:predicted RNA methylase